MMECNKKICEGVKRNILLLVVIIYGPWGALTRPRHYVVKKAIGGEAKAELKAERGWIGVGRGTGDEYFYSVASCTDRK